MIEYRPAPGLRVYPFDAAGQDESLLVESARGRRWQISHATLDLLRALEEADTLEAAASRLEARWQVPVPVERLRTYLDRTVVPSGLVESSSDMDGGVARARHGPRSPLEFRVILLSANVVAHLTRPFAVLFDPGWFWPGFGLAVTVAIWILAFEVRSGTGLLGTIGTPQVLGLFLASTLIHELGHASACRRGNHRPGEIGFGLYLIFPVLYARVDEAWRLSRPERVIVDLGGIYLQLLFGLVLMAGAWIWTPLRPTASGAFMTIVLSVTASANPWLRLDGYWLISDVLGVPNLRDRSLMALRGALSRLWKARHTAPRLSPGGIRRSTAAALFVYAVASIVFFVFFGIRILSEYPDYVVRSYFPLVSGRIETFAAGLAEMRIGQMMMALFTLVAPTAVVVGVPLCIVLLVRTSIPRLVRRRVSR